MPLNQPCIIMIEKVIGIEADQFLFHPEIAFKFIPFLAVSSSLSLKDLVVLTRPECENDVNFRHFATYTIVENSKGEILTYSRAKGGAESRLHGKWSIGIGGHIDAVDCVEVASVREVFSNATLAELDEELFGSKIRSTRRYAFPSSFCEKGYWLADTENAFTLLFDNSNEVGQRHIAVISRIRLDDDEISQFAKTMESKGSQWVSQERLQSDEFDLENWSKIIIDNFDEIPGCGFAPLCTYGEKPFKHK